MDALQAAVARIQLLPPGFVPPDVINEFVAIFDKWRRLTKGNAFKNAALDAGKCLMDVLHHATNGQLQNSSEFCINEQGIMQANRIIELFSTLNLNSFVYEKLKLNFLMRAYQSTPLKCQQSLRQLTVFLAKSLLHKLKKPFECLKINDVEIFILSFDYTAEEFWKAECFPNVVEIINGYYWFYLCLCRKLDEVKESCLLMHNVPVIKALLCSAKFKEGFLHASAFTSQELVLKLADCSQKTTPDLAVQIIYENLHVKMELDEYYADFLDYFSYFISKASKFSRLLEFKSVFHDWTMSKIYTEADACLTFLVLFSLAVEGFVCISYFDATIAGFLLEFQCFPFASSIISSVKYCKKFTKTLDLIEKCINSMLEAKNTQKILSFISCYGNVLWHFRAYFKAIESKKPFFEHFFALYFNSEVLKESENLRIDDEKLYLYSLCALTSFSAAKKHIIQSLLLPMIENLSKLSKSCKDCLFVIGACWNFILENVLPDFELFSLDHEQCKRSPFIAKHYEFFVLILLLNGKYTLICRVFSKIRSRFFPIAQNFSYLNCHFNGCIEILYDLAQYESGIENESKHNSCDNAIHSPLHLIIGQLVSLSLGHSIVDIPIDSSVKDRQLVGLNLFSMAYKSLIKQNLREATNFMHQTTKVLEQALQSESRLAARMLLSYFYLNSMYELSYLMLIFGSYSQCKYYCLKGEHFSKQLESSYWKDNWKLRSQLIQSFYRLRIEDRLSVPSSLKQYYDYCSIESLIKLDEKPSWTLAIAREKLSQYHQQKLSLLKAAPTDIQRLYGDDLAAASLFATTNHEYSYYLALRTGSPKTIEQSLRVFMRNLPPFYSDVRIAAFIELSNGNGLARECSYIPPFSTFKEFLNLIENFFEIIFSKSLSKSHKIFSLKIVEDYFYIIKWSHEECKMHRVNLSEKNIQWNEYLNQWANIMESNSISLKSAPENPAAWWKCRNAVNEKILNFLSRIENEVLSFYKEIFVDFKQDQLQILVQNLKRLIELQNLNEQKLICFAKMALFATDNDILFAKVLNFYGISTKNLLLIKTEICGCLIDDFLTERSNITLILSKELFAVPFENILFFKKFQVFATRIDSIYTLQHILTNFKRETLDTKPIINGILNPSGDLLDTQRTFEETFKSFFNDSIVGKCPSEEEYISMLKNADLFFYFGHGSGAVILKNSTLIKNDIKATCFLIGCSSGVPQGLSSQFDLFGSALYHLWAGSAIVVSMLWDITDKDIDRIMRKTLDIFIENCYKKPILNCLQQSMDACLLKGATAASIVIYGAHVCN